jgi:hypothetical protein
LQARTFCALSPNPVPRPVVPRQPVVDACDLAGVEISIGLLEHRGPARHRLDRAQQPAVQDAKSRSPLIRHSGIVIDIAGLRTRAVGDLIYLRRQLSGVQSRGVTVTDDVLANTLNVLSVSANIPKSKLLSSLAEVLLD